MSLETITVGFGGIH